MTDEEKRNLRHQLAEAQVEIENCKQECSSWKQKYDELLLCGEVANESEAADAQPTVKEQQDPVPFIKFDKLRKKYGLLTERMLQKKEKYEQDKKSLIEKIEEQQTELRELRGKVSDEVGPPRAPIVINQVGDDIVGLYPDEMSHETALKEVQQLRSMLAAKNEKINNLELQIRSFATVHREHHKVKMDDQGQVPEKVRIYAHNRG